MKHGKALAGMILLSVGLLAAGLAAGTGGQGEEIPAADPPLAAEAAAPRVGDIIVTHEYVGGVESGGQGVGLDI